MQARSVCLAIVVGGALATAACGETIPTDPTGGAGTGAGTTNSGAGGVGGNGGSTTSSMDNPCVLDQSNLDNCKLQ